MIITAAQSPEVHKTVPEVARLRCAPAVGMGPKD